jgi:hypothetical protein
MVFISRKQNALNTVQGAAPYAHTLSDLEKWMGTPGYLLPDQGSNGIDLPFRDWSSQTASADKLEHSVDAQHPQSLFANGSEFHEYVAAKEWQFHRFPPIAPAMHFGDQRQKGGHALFAQPLLDDFFVSGASVHGIPTLNPGSRHRRHIRKPPRLSAGIHSFAL